MSGGVSLPSVLQLLDGTPHRKVASAMFENLPLAKVLQGGNLAGLMQKVLADGNLSSVLANPMAALTGGLQAQIGQAVTQLQSSAISDAGALISALTGSSGLSSALTAFQAAGDNLSGLTNGQAGLMALAGHDSLLGMLGGAVPAALDPARVLGPVASEPLLAGLSSALPSVVASVISGGMSVSAATQWVSGQAAIVSTVTAGSADALAQGQSMQMLASAVATVSGLVAPVPGVPRSPVQTAIGTFVQPGARLAMNAALAAQIRADTHAPVDTAAMTSLD
ncbi:hypothetical protein [Methylobacterium sp. J-076]|uniref:hypothetical protein n=1 Tax=Methylobacterium sp. J-076 TaxID=2836655 RepID=UPI001FBA161B|nr:hypothetical protein [Methylobacterium sp. J-076]MCJ2012665.1 hypothetical protein [Methylobacterium sp. J-076]